MPQKEIDLSFKDYLLKDRQNRRILQIAALAIVIQFAVFKYFYPFASYIHGDSFTYLETAYLNLSVNTYLVGYSMFLRFFSIFSTSDLALTAFQYLSIQVTVLWLLFTLFYFYRPARVVRICLLCFMIFNPLFLHMGNLVSSDAFFLALSLGWVTILVWIIHRPTVRLMVWHTVFIFVAFTVRYNALIYLPISALAFLLSRQPARLKGAGISAGALVIGLFVLYTGEQYRSLTGTWQYSPFAGWQIANNAMYAYRYVEPDQRRPVPEKFQKLDNMIRDYFDSTRDTKKHPAETLMASSVYMWSAGMPLYNYRDSVFRNDTTATDLKRWAYMGPFFKEYGQTIISQYPGYYARYFLLPNAKKYYAPPTEFLTFYNTDKDSVAPIAQLWFRYKSQLVTTRTKDRILRSLEFYPIFSGIINGVMLAGLLGFVLNGGLKQKTSFQKGIMLAGTIWLLNAAFTICVSSAALRFQAFPLLLTTIFAGLLLGWIWQMASLKPEPSAQGQGEAQGTGDSVIPFYSTS